MEHGALWRAAHDALSESIFEVTREATIVCDREERVLSWSRGAEILLETPAAVATGRRLADVIDAAEYPTGARAIALDGGVFHRAPDPAAQRKPLVWVVRALRGERGAALGLLYQVRDVSPIAREPVDQEALLGRAAERIVARQDRTMLVLDRQHRVVAQNSVAAQYVRTIMGRPLAVGEDVLVTSAPGTIEGYLAKFRRALEGETVKSERRLTYPNGVDRVVEVWYQPLRDGPGPTQEVVVDACDVTNERRERARAELMMRSLQTAPVGVVISDAGDGDFPITFVNAAFERITGYSYEDVVGRNCRFLQGPYRDQPGLELIRTTLAAGGSCRTVLRNTRKDGSPFWNELTLAPIHDASGQLTHYVGTLQDVTERVSLEERVRVAQNAEALARVAASVVHDFNNTLMSIMAHSFLALDHLEPGSPARTDIDAIVTLTEGAAATTKRMLIGSRYSTGEPSCIDPQTVLGDMRTVLRKLVPQRVILELLEPSQPAFTFIDRRLLEQLVMNLCLNAVDAMPGGGTLRIAIETSPHPGGSSSGDAVFPPGEWVSIVVADTGVGMSAETMQRVFEPFFTTKAAGHGTGLGLFSAREVIRQAGGHLLCTSEVGVGTVFRVILPRVQPRPERARASEAPGEEIPLRERRIVVVEDDLAVRAMFCSALRAQGAVPFPAGDVATARQLLRELGPSLDLLVTDIALGSASGLALLPLVPPGRPILVVTANPQALPEDPGELRVLVKPCRPTQLVAAAREAIASTRELTASQETS